MSALMTAIGWMAAGAALLLWGVIGYSAYTTPSHRPAFWLVTCCAAALAVAVLLGLNWTAWTGGAR